MTKREKRTLIMGILNVTPDSFSDGGKFIDAAKAVEHAKQMVKEGADIIDVGGESSRPGSEPVSEEEELKRVKPVIERLAKEINVPISIDTYNPRVAEECIKSGASIVNDITGLDEDMRKVAAKYKVPVIIMHMLGKPKTMQKKIAYRDIVDDIKSFLKQRIEKAKQAGITDITIDPGIGFGKTTGHNLEIIRRLSEFKELKCPILIGTSRKSFIGNITCLPETERLEGTIASVVAAIMNGANIIRVHDVKECKRAVQVADAINCTEDTIILSNVQFLCNLGITQKERKEKQPILMDIRLSYNIIKAAASDSIEDTINYSELNKKLKELIEEKQYNLIEAIAEDTANFILKNYKLKKVHITVKKPSAIKAAEYAAVDIVREKWQ